RDARTRRYGRSSQRPGKGPFERSSSRSWQPSSGDYPKWARRRTCIGCCDKAMRAYSPDDALLIIGLARSQSVSEPGARLRVRSLKAIMQNELRVFVPRSRRKSSVGPTRARALLVGRTYMEISGEQG